MSATERDDVVRKLSKTAKTNENKHVKAAVLGVSYDNLCQQAFLEHLQRLQGPVETMVHSKRKTLAEEQGLFAQIKVGDWVEIEPDYSPGICSDGGAACVLGIHTEPTNVVGGSVANIITAVDVHFLVFNTKERRVLLERVVVIPMPYKMHKPNLRVRKSGTSTSTVVPKAAPDRTSLEWLKYGLESRRHEKEGWLLLKLEELNILPANNKSAKWARVLTDYHCQLAYLEGLKHALGAAYKDPREYHGVRGTDTGGKFVSQKKRSQQGVPKNIYTIPYLMWAYNVTKCTFKRKLKEAKQGYTPVSTPKKHIGTSVIDCREMARERYNAKHFYCHQNALSSRDPSEGDMNTQLWHKYKHRVAYWGQKFDMLVAEGGDITPYERLAREHDERQPYVQDDLLDALHRNNCTSYRALSMHVNGWCAPSTIEHWFKAHPTYLVYAKNIKPGLTEQNRAKQVVFSKHVHNRWGLPATTTKILWIHSDEKWFHALVPRNNAKACSELGLERSSYSAHHKSHIGKVMAHCTVGYCFDSTVENGGEGFLIGLHRCANFKVPLRDVRFSSKDPVTNKITFAGNAIKHPKGVPYLVDCNVTGSNPGTATVPCFPLKLLWENSLMPAIKAMVASTGPCAGAQVVYQEDNAGPHTEHGYTLWIREQFELLGWKLELQAPQGISTTPTFIPTYFHT